MIDDLRPCSCECVYILAQQRRLVDVSTMLPPHLIVKFLARG
jgi:hypothetical protein